MPNHVDSHHADSAAAAATGPPPSKASPKLLSFFFFQAIIMTAIISLFFVFVGVAAILLLHICFAGSAFHQRRRRSTCLPNSGFSVEDLKKLPRFRFGRVGPEAARECVVCLEALREGEWCRSLPDCDHIFHSNCVDKWLIKVPACPTCRAPVRFNRGSAGSENIGLKVW